MDALLSGDAPPDAIAIVDADSVADRGMLAALESELAAGHHAVQADYVVLPVAGSPRSELVAAGVLPFPPVSLSGGAGLGRPAALFGAAWLPDTDRPWARPLSRSSCPDPTPTSAL